MLQQPTKEKLHALRLHGMIEAIERQEQDEEARGLSFLDRSTESPLQWVREVYWRQKTR